jgi:hypothetical protein
MTEQEAFGTSIPPCPGRPHLMLLTSDPEESAADRAAAAASPSTANLFRTVHYDPASGKWFKAYHLTNDQLARMSRLMDRVVAVSDRKKKITLYIVDAFFMFLCPYA